ncbi:unnamed protein product, partial [Musa textilis]
GAEAAAALLGGHLPLPRPHQSGPPPRQAPRPLRRRPPRHLLHLPLGSPTHVPLGSRPPRRLRRPSLLSPLLRRLRRRRPRRRCRVQQFHSRVQGRRAPQPLQHRRRPRRRGRPVTCIVYTMLLPWAADVAREHGIPSIHYWIQPATVFAVYYHCFHDYGAVVDAHRDDPSFTVTFPRLPPIKISDVPSFLTSPVDHPLYSVYLALREAFAALDTEKAASSSKPRVLVNTFDELEPDALAAVDEIDMLTIGPLIPSWSSSGTAAPKDTETGAGGDIFKPDDKGYMEWLESQPEWSVVYVSFGSLHHFTKRELEELSAGLEECGRPYMWVVRRDNREEGNLREGSSGQGMVVEWCSQVKVLSHAAVGCFVTHCGWNSMLESLACGVPTVGVPRLSDQRTNARMADGAWGTGVTAELGEDDVVEAGELKRCVQLVMGEGERGKEMRRKAEQWKERARAAVSEGGSSDRNLTAFLEDIGKRS